MFAALLLGIVMIVGGLSALLYEREREQVMRSTALLERASVRLMQQVTAGVFDELVGDLLFLAEQNELEALVAGDAGARAALAAEYLAMMRHKAIYDQIRFLDRAGLERVRVNDANGAPVVVPEAALQDKRHRYYFSDVIVLEPGEVYVSPLDLNIEHGQIERPFKPMIRIGTPVVDAQGRKAGLVLLNVFGEHLLERLEAAATTALGEAMLLNHEGYWLLAPDPADRWGFMLPGRAERSFGRRFPQAWEQIQRERDGQIRNQNGLFSFVTLHPLHAGLVSSTGAAEPAAPSRVRLDAQSYTWVLVSWVPPAEIAAIGARILRQGVPMAAVTLVLLAVGAWFLAVAIVRGRVDQARLWELAHQDGLTGLPNRILFFDRLGHVHRNAQRYQRAYALLYLDLNGFKGINDRYGHAAGDEVLIAVARRLGQRIRGSDTVARIGGDELAVLLSEFTGTDAIRALGHELIALIEQPIPLAEVEVSLGASIGAAAYPIHGDTPDALLRGADQAMYQAKTQRLGFCFARSPSESESGAADDSSSVARASHADD